MASRGFSTDSPYVQSVQGLRRLHLLAVSGRDEEPEADAVRASLERPWFCLSEAERKRITGLSEDLYTIGEPPPPMLPMNPQAQRKLVEAVEARQAGEWDQALELLRGCGRHVEPALLAYLRGTVWMEAGDYATAALFFHRAALLEPANENYASLHLYALSRSDPTAAVARAQEALAHDEAQPPAVVVRAVEIRFAAAQGLTDVDARPVLLELVRVLERTLARLQTEEARQSSSYDSTQATAVAFLGFCHDHLGDRGAALSYYNAGLEADPTDDDLLVARGILRYGADPGAVGDFEQAIRSESPVIWPYFFLAHHYLVSNRFDECGRMCEQGLTRPASETVRANLYEWLAISRAELGFPPEQVRAAFEDAVRLEPTNERIRRNFRGFQERLARQPVGPRAWERPGVAVVQAYGHAEYQPALAA